jgi:uncharacterized delta-60 repeat protein
MKKLLFTFFYGLSAVACMAQASFFDPSFGTGGKVIVNYDGTSSGVLKAVSVQVDGKIIAAGVVNGRAAIGRYKENGKIDSGFAVNGFYIFPTISSVFYRVKLQSDGKVIAEGNVPISVGDPQYLTVRLNPDGTPDISFGSSGIVITDFGPFSSDYGKAITILSDTRILIVGDVSSYNIGLARLQPDGVIDSSFGLYGMETSVLGEPIDMDIAADGKIVVGGTSSATPFGLGLMVARYLPDGAPDTSFNHTGLVNVLAGDSWNYGGVVRVLPDGKVLVAGSGTFGAQGSDFVVLRYNTDGTLDGSFGAGGIAHADFAYSNDLARAMVIAPDGKILLSGDCDIEGKESFGVVRLNADGSIDHTFGNYGWIVNPIRVLNDRAYGLALQADGKVILTGSSVNVSPYTSPAIARFLPAPSVVSGVCGMNSADVLYPNPAAGKLFVKAPGGAEIAGIMVTDVLGRRVLAQVVDGAINIAGWADGLYFFRVAFRDGTAVVERVWVRN